MFNENCREIERLFKMYFHHSGHSLEMAENRWQNLLVAANILVDLTDQPVANSLCQLSMNPVVSNFTSVFLNSYLQGVKPIQKLNIPTAMKNEK